MTKKIKKRPTKKSTKKVAMKTKKQPLYKSKNIQLLLATFVVGIVGLMMLLNSFAAPGNKSKDDPINFVVAVSVDGLRSDAIRKLGPTKAPNFYKLMRNGATTLNARPDYTHTITLPNHTSMVTGRPVLGKNGHKVAFNYDNKKTIHRYAGTKVRSVFDVVHDRGGRTELITMKDKFGFINRSWNAKNGAPDKIGVNNGRDKIDVFAINESNNKSFNAFINRLSNKPSRFSFIHIRYPDSAGHEFGWMTPKYLNAVKQSDVLVGKIYSTIQAKKSLRAHVAMIVTADHGGKGKSHSNAKLVEDYKIPFMVVGPNVAKGKNLYDLNPRSRKAPRNSRPTYNGTQPIRNSDLANLSTDLLDYPAIPGSVVNKKQNLYVFPR